MFDPQEDYKPRHRDHSWTAEVRSLFLDAHADLANLLYTPRHSAHYAEATA